MMHFFIESRKKYTHKLPQVVMCETAMQRDLGPEIVSSTTSLASLYASMTFFLMNKAVKMRI